jgi:hypothetical protein
MTEATNGRVREVLCPECGRPVPASGAPVVRCADCFDGYLRSVDADFLDNYARLGARSRIVVAEACLRSLVLSDLGDRKLLAMTVYEQFVGAATELVALYHALLERRATPIMRGILGFSLTADAARAFFGRLAEDGPTETLAALGLPHHEQVVAVACDLDKRERKQVRAALHEAAIDLERLTAYREVGEEALANAAARLGYPVALAEKTDWLTETSVGQDQVATLALNRRSHRVEVDLLGTDEETLGNVVDGIETITRLTRNLIFAFVSLHAPTEFRHGFSGP